MKYTDGSPVHVRVELPDNAVFCKVWKAQVGRIPLYLLDTNLPENSPGRSRDHRHGSTAAGTEMRIKQEIVLGIGGVRALEALEHHAHRVPHERGARRVPRAGAHPRAARAASAAHVRRGAPAGDGDERLHHAHAGAGGHRHVLAGPDARSISRHFYPPLKLDEEGFLALGREDVTNKKQGFSMAVLAIRLADIYNGVSELHGDVSRKMWHNLWPQRAGRRSADQARDQRHPRAHVAVARTCSSCSIATSATSG